MERNVEGTRELFYNVTTKEEVDYIFNFFVEKYDNNFDSTYSRNFLYSKVMATGVRLYITIDDNGFISSLDENNVKRIEEDNIKVFNHVNIKEHLIVEQWKDI